MFYGGESAYLGELIAAPINPRYGDQAVVLAFDQQYELLWAGAPSGMLYTLQSPTLEPYAAWKAHPATAGAAGGAGGVQDLVPAAEGCALSVSPGALALHGAGGVLRMRVPQRPCKGEAGADAVPEEDWLCCALEPGAGGSRVLVGGSGGRVTTVDLLGGKRAGQAEVAGEAVVALKAAPGRGALVMGTESGRLLLGDARGRGGAVRADHSALAHAGGLAAMDARADMVATCGYGVRMGQAVPDSLVKVFDLRYALRPLFTLPAPAPAAVAWHPALPTSLLVAGADGTFSVADVSNPGAAHTFQIDTGGDAIIAAAYSPSGEILAFSGSGGYVHLWSASHQPRACYSSPGALPSLLARRGRGGAA